MKKSLAKEMLSTLEHGYYAIESTIRTPLNNQIIIFPKLDAGKLLFTYEPETSTIYATYTYRVPGTPRFMTYNTRTNLRSQIEIDLDYPILRLRQYRCRLYILTVDSERGTYFLISYSLERNIILRRWILPRMDNDFITDFAVSRRRVYVITLSGYLHSFVRRGNYLTEWESIWVDTRCTGICCYQHRLLIATANLYLLVMTLDLSTMWKIDYPVCIY